MRFSLHQHITENKLTYTAALGSLLAGICVGQAQLELLEHTAVSELSAWLEQLMSADIRSLHHTLTFWSALFQQLKSVLLIWLLGMTLIGAPLILGVLFYRGISIGFTLHLLFQLRSWQGIGIFMATVLPQNVIYLPGLLIWSVIALNFSRNLLKRKKNTPRSFPSLFLRYQCWLPVFGILMAAGAFIEAFLSPAILSFILS